MVIILAVARSDFAPIEDDVMMHRKRTAMSLAIPDLMSANLLRIFNERNRRRRAAAIRTMYAKDCFFADAIESVSGWDGVHDKVDRLHAAHPGFVFQPSGPAVAHHGLACHRWRSQCKPRARMAAFRVISI